jgi:formylglycine-generating enzyme required for sulfatase activity
MGWERGPNGHVFAILPAPLTFRMGSPDQEQGRDPEETPHYRRIERSLEVSIKEVTVGQFRKFDKDHRHDPPTDDAAGDVVRNISWYQAIRYCNWLSEHAKIDRSQWCYPEMSGRFLFIPDDAVTRNGYRLPTESEWEYLCRAGTETSWSFGESQALLPRYAWTWLNSGNHSKPPGQLLPNNFGMFDVMGNVWEWCQDGPAGAYPGVPKPPYPGTTAENPDMDAGRFERIDLKAPDVATWRMLRGGSFSSAPERSRSAHRDWAGALDPLSTAGFRVVRTLRPEKLPASRRTRGESR